MPPNVGLRVHKIAAHLRYSCAPPRTLYEEPPCRFCGSPQADLYHHHVRCPAIYVRMVHALRAVTEELRMLLEAPVHAVTHHLAYLELKHGVVAVLISTEQGSHSALL